MLEPVKQTKIDNPSNEIIKQVKELIASGLIKPGEKLPPERKLAQSFNVGRSVVREAIRKLEFYGIVRTIPQSGTTIEPLGVVAVQGLISDVLNIEKKDFLGLVETRILLEVEAAGKASERRTSEDIAKLQNALSAYERKVYQGNTATEEDLLFHIKIAEAARNNVLRTLMLIITPDIIKNFNQLDICKSNRLIKVCNEHRKIVEHIVHQKADLARQAMRKHLSDVLKYATIN